MSGASLLLLLVAIGLLVGVLIGCIGVGGVLLVPSLTYLGGIEIHVAIASCMLSYLFSGLVGAVIFARRGSIRWSQGLWLCAGAMPGAYLGAAAVSVAPGQLLELVIAGLTLLAGVNALSNTSATTTSRSLGRNALVPIGVVTGFASALSGTGGPLVLVPILVWLRVPVLAAVGLSQLIQVPIAVLATAGNLVHGRLDISLGLGIAVVLMIGAALGARLAHALPIVFMKRLVAGVLIVVGLGIIARVISRTIA